MLRDYEHVPNRSHVAPEPLPRTFEPELRALDARLASHARAVIRTPHGLTDRVMAASAPRLPGAGDAPADRAAGRWRPRLVRAPADPARRWMPTARGWSRIGLAASVALVCVLAANLRPSAEPPIPVAGTIDWLRADPLEAVDERVAHLLDTGGLSSIDEVTGELESMIAALEM